MTFRSLPILKGSSEKGIALKVLRKTGFRSQTPTQTSHVTWSSGGFISPDF